MDKLSLKTRLILIMALPIAGLLYFSLSVVFSKLQVERGIVAMRQLTDLAEASSTAIHELQKERGLSAGFIGSRGEQFGPELQKQRQESDARIAKLKTLIGSLDAQRHGADFKGALDAVGQKFAGLDETRKKISGLAFAPPQSFEYYTGTVGALLDLVSFVSKASTHEQIAKDTTAYLMFLNAKEQAGRERAVANSAFAADRMDGAAYRRFVSIVSVQDAYLAAFQSYGAREAIAYQKEKLEGPFARDFARMRQAVFDRATDGRYGIEPSQWFATASARIDAMKEVEDKLTTHLEALMDELGGRARFDLIFALALSALVIGAALWLSFRIIRGLVRQLGGEPAAVATAAHRIADGDLSQQVVTLEGDNVSVLASMKTMQATLSRLVAEIQSMVNAAVQGDFGKRIELGDKKGFGRDIGASLNQLAETTHVGLNDVMRVSGALAHGDLSQKISQEYPGVFGQTKAGVNNTVDALSELVAEIRRVADAAARGDFSQRIDLADKRGFGEDIGRLLNQLSDTTEVGLRDIMRVAQALARGDLTQTIANEYPGLFGEARDGVNTTVANLRQLVRQIKEAVDQIDTAAREIALGNQDLSSRTEEQASSLEETASSMEELTSTVKENESRVAKAGDIATKATDIAARGGEIVKASVTTMAEITESSKRIADIIGVIDGIAFQTNILALNAAVEAARAGEQGRGFAVVASEVRNLAQRSSEAAKDIKNLISDSVAKVENGTAQVNLAGESMDEIVSGIRSVTDIMSEIRTASREQTTGIEQVTQAVAQMDQVTQQNAALVEEAAAAAESLQEQAEGLLRSVSTFNLGETPAAARAPKAKEPPVVRKPLKAVAAGGRGGVAAEDDWAEF